MYKSIKRILDVFISALALPFVFISVLFIGPLIYITDKGPIFYKAKRIGKAGELFSMIKFRSMYVNAPDIRNSDGTTYNSDTDVRVTKIGSFLRKTSLDELPQFINVLIGDMSVVGPRPDLPDALEKLYTEEIKKKLKVRPGITGLNQAYFRNAADISTRFCNDVYYAEHISFILDVKILFKTFSTVIKKEGVFTNK